jgi:carbon-monoxide dehydrogenase medium subunit
VRPRPFWYHRPSTRADVDRLLDELEGPTYLLAGGQTLVAELNRRTVRPAHIVDLNSLRDEPDRAAVGRDELRLGPLVRLAAVEHDAAARARLPVLADILPVVASPAIRARATVLGNLLCADPASELAALALLLGGRVAWRGRLRHAVTPVADALARRFDGGGALAATGRVWADELVLDLPAPGTRVAFAEVGRRYAARAVVGVVGAFRPGSDAQVRLAVFGLRRPPVVTRIDAGAGRPDRLRTEVREAVAAAVTGHDDRHATAEYRRTAAANLAAACAVRVACGGGGTDRP